MKTKFTILASLFILTISSCSDENTYYPVEFEDYHATRSNEIENLGYSLTSFIDTVAIPNSDVVKIEEILFYMQNDLGAGYKPLFKLLSKDKISKIYRGQLTHAPAAAYNVITNSIIIGSASSLRANMLEEELIHAGQNRIYSEGISQYAAKAGTPNIEFEAKLTQDIISYINGGIIGLGAGRDRKSVV